MSRSKKLDVYTDKRGWKTRLYLRRIRRTTKQFIKIKALQQGFTESTIPNPKALQNDYDYSDYTLANSYKNKIPK